MKALGGSFTYASHYTCKFYVHYQGVVLRGVVFLRSKFSYSRWQMGLFTCFQAVAVLIKACLQSGDCVTYREVLAVCEGVGVER